MGNYWRDMLRIHDGPNKLSSYYENDDYLPYNKFGSFDVSSTGNSLFVEFTATNSDLNDDNFGFIATIHRSTYSHNRGFPRQGS